MTRPRILIVEDEGIIARDLHRELLDLGYEPVDIVMSGEEAVLAAETRRPQLVLMDINLTGTMDGIDAAIRIRERTGIPTVFLTAYATDEVVARAKTATPLGYIVKPFDAQSLRSTLEVALHRDAVYRRLEASERRYRALVETAHDAIITTDGDGWIIGWSRAAVELFGHEENEALGQHITLIVPPSSYEEQRQIYDAIRAGDTTRDFRIPIERRALRKGGAEIAVEVSFAHWRDDQAEFISIFLRDIRERQQLEQQFRQAQKMEVVGRLAGGVAHDFNNILTAINGTCDIVLRTLPKDDPYREDFEDIREAGGRAERLTRQLLTFSRKQVSERTVTSIGKIVERAASLLKRLLGEDVTLVIVPVESGTSDAANVDPSQFEQVLLNLAVNARDAMPDGGTLTVRTERITLTAADVDRRTGLSPGPHVRFSVTDTGTGMTDEVRSHLFEPFFTTKDRGKGTGLGLATVYGVVSQHGGTISVDTALGRGTTFTVCLPAADAAGAREATYAGTVHEGTETILLVEDDAAARKVTARLLKNAGYTVLVACDGLEALRVLSTATTPIKLVLTDIVMPNMKGTELADHIEALPAPPAVLFMSGYVEDHIDEGRLKNANFITKPFTDTELTRRIREALSR